MLQFNNNKNFKVIITFLILFIILTFSFASVLAESISGEEVIVESDKVLEKTSFLSGNNIRIDGDVEASAFATGGNVEVNGTIDGDLFVAGQNITINGTVKGSLFIAGQNIDIKGNIENNIYSAGARIEVKSKNEGSAFLAGQNIYLGDSSAIEKDAFIGGSKIYQKGVIEGELFTSSESLSIGGRIGGDLNYDSKNEANFSENAQVDGEVNWRQPEQPKGLFTFSNLMSLIFSLLSALIVWIAVRFIRPSFWEKLAETALTSPLKTLGFGALALILVPIISLLLMFTVIGIPLSLILIFIYIIILYISRIILSTSIAQCGKVKFNWTKSQSLWIFLLGLIVLSVLGFIPILGFISVLLVASFGLGSIVLSIRK